MTEQQVQALIVRALKTFAQAVIAFIITNIANITSLNAGKVLIGSAIAAGLSAVMNAYLKPVEAK